MTHIRKSIDRRQFHATYPANCVSFEPDLGDEGLALDLTETAVLFCPLYAVTSKDRSRAQEVCRASYTVAA